MCDGTGKITVFGTTQVQIDNFLDPAQGSLCSFYIGSNSVLLHPGKELFVSGQTPTLDLEGRLESGTIHIAKSGRFLMKSKDFVTDRIELDDETVMSMLVVEADGSQTVDFTNLRLGFGVTLNFTESNVTVRATHLEMLPSSVIKTSARPAQLLIEADSAMIHDNAQISVSGQGLDSLTVPAQGEQIYPHSLLLLHSQLYL